jgi:ligand-binding sensor domain-containing protein
VVVPGPDGVWTVGSARAGERRALTWVSADLSRFTVNEDALGRGTSVLLAQRLLYSGDGLWLGTSFGLFQMPAGQGGTGRFYDVGAGLPGPNVLSLAKAPDGVWVGTAQGLALITPAGAVTRMAGYDRAIPALAAQRESLWVGTVDGLALLAPGSTAPTLPAELAAVPTLRAPIAALANAHDTIVAATSDQLGWRDPKDGSWTVLRPRAPTGTITALAPDAGGVWIAGTGGLVFWDIGHQTFRGISVPGDIPAAIRDVTVQGDYVWVATDAGLVRLSRDAVLHR